MIDKGKVSALLEDGKKATVIPSRAQGNVTIPLVVPKLLIEGLEVGMEVVYVTFEDNTGIILSRLDGDWSHKIDDDITITGDVASDGSISADSVSAEQDVTASGISLTNHIHGGVEPGSGKTSRPE